MSVEEHEAIVLRCVRYGERDLVVQLLTRDRGRVAAMARRALSAKQPFHARIEPFSCLRVQLGKGRGDLANLRQAELVTVWENMRANWRLQSRAAALLDLVGRLSVMDDDAQAAYYLTRNILQFLNDADPESQAADALAVAGALKCLHVAGIAPALGSCVRQSGDAELVAWSAADGGVVGRAALEPGDSRIDHRGLEAARYLMTSPLAAIATGSTVIEPRDLRWVEQVAVRTMVATHVGAPMRPLTA